MLPLQLRCGVAVRRLQSVAAPAVRPVPAGFVALVGQPQSGDPGLAGAGAGARLDAHVRSTWGVAGEPPALAALARWLRSRRLRVYDAQGAEVRLAPRAALATRLRAGDRLVAHAALAAELQPLVAGAGAAGAGGAGAAAGFARAEAGMRPPAWLRGCLRWAGRDLVAVAKPAGVAVQAGSGLRDRDTVDFWLPSIAREAGGGDAGAAAAGADTALRLVHRLDADVSGLLLLARGRAAAERVRAALAARTGIVKEYLALVAAPLPRGVAAAGRIAAAVGGAQALTEYQAEAVGAGHTLLLLRPVTGRKHQLRQHVRVLWKGTAAIANDAKFGGAGVERARDAPLMLHAWRLRLSRGVAAGSDAGSSAAAAAISPDWLREVRAVVGGGVRRAGAATARVVADGLGGIVITDVALPPHFCAQLAPLLGTPPTTLN